MNIYGVFIKIAFFVGNNSYKNFHTNKRGLKLFVKKNSNLNSYFYTPKTINQDKYFKYLNNETHKIIVSTGPAGTGKTLFACQKAIEKMKKREIDKVVITRPIVTVEEDIGFLPGNIIKKMDPWTKPIFDIFLEHYSKAEFDLMLNNCKIEICPLAFMRGRTFKNSFIIADEMQNSSPNQMKMLVTRIGVNSRIVITGDLNQTDILKENGLHDFISKVENYNDSEMIKLVRFENDDIERSEIVKEVIKIYDYKKPNKKIENSISLYNNTRITNNIIYSKNKDSDAALIPKHHMSNNYDIFFESREF
jgi:phosphate starvation-inducible PhoH-like protein